MVGGRILHGVDMFYPSKGDSVAFVGPTRDLRMAPAAPTEVASPIARTARSRLDWVSPQEVFYQVSTGVLASSQGTLENRSDGSAVPGVALHFPSILMAANRVIGGKWGRLFSLFRPLSFRSTEMSVSSVASRCVPVVRCRRMLVEPSADPHGLFKMLLSFWRVPSRMLLICYLARYNIVSRHAAHCQQEMW